MINMIKGLENLSLSPGDRITVLSLESAQNRGNQPNEGNLQWVRLWLGRRKQSVVLRVERHKNKPGERGRGKSKSPNPWMLNQEARYGDWGRI